MKAPKGRIARAALIALEILGVLIAVAAGLTGFIVWRLESGPLALPVVKRSAEFAIERALPPGHKAAVSRATLAKGRDRGTYDLRFENVVIEAPASDDAANLSSVALTFSLHDLLRGAAGPRHILISDAMLRIERGADQRISVAYAPSGAGRRNFFRVLTGGRFFREAFRSAELINAEVHFIDKNSGNAWRATGASARITRTDASYSARLDGAFSIDGKRASIMLRASYSEGSGIISSDLRFTDAPLGDVLSIFYGPGAAILSSPLTGEASITLADSGAVLSSHITGRAGVGLLTLGDFQAEVSSVDFDASFSPETNEFALHRLRYEIGASQGELAGTAEVKFTASTLEPSSIAFDIKGEDVILGASGLLPEPLLLNHVETNGAYHVGERRLVIYSMRADLLGVSASGSLSLLKSISGGKPVSPAVNASLRVDGSLQTDRLLKAWPLEAAAGARDFVETRMPRGAVKNITLEVDLPAGAIGVGRPMPDEALALTFEVIDATAIYSPGMTPLSDASGSAKLTGNRFVISVPHGRVGKVVLSDGEVDFTSLSRGAPVHFTFSARGAARDILAVLDEEPLALLKSTDLSPSQFVGDATARIRITRPNLREAPRESYGYGGVAKFDNLSVAEFYAGTDLTDLEGKIDLASRSMHLVANATFGEAPIKVDWTQMFYSADGRSRFTISGDVDSSTGDIFGWPTRNLIRGPVAFTADAAGDLGNLDSLSLNADFTKSELLFDALGWRKPQGASAAGVLALSFVQGRTVVTSASLTGSGIDIKGKAALSREGAIDTASFDRFFIDGSADFALTATRLDAGPLDIALTGALLNAGPLAEMLIDAKPTSDDDTAEADWGRGVFVRGRVDELLLRAETRFRDAALDFRRTNDRIEALEFSARTAEGAPISMLLRETGAETGPSRAVTTRTDDIGALFAGLFGVTSVKGGEGSMEIFIDRRAQGEMRGLAGMIEARNMRIVRAPLLARVFAAGSLTGLSDLLNGEGIELSNALGEFQFHQGELVVEEARAAGPSVGITATGVVTTGESGAVNLAGAIAPAYRVNSLLGKAPVIGELFVNREGEGVLALSYQVTGPPSAPTVSVNPLSALAPGFLRRMFEPNFGASSEPAESASDQDN